MNHPTPSFLPQPILFASGNLNKIKEIEQLTQGSDILLRFPKQIKTEDPLPELVEGETSYLENAKLKADGYGNWANLPCLADDSGIEVKSLNGAPGVISAHYAGHAASAEEHNDYLLEKLKNVSDRYAQMRAVLCLRMTEGIYLFSEAVLPGVITKKPRGASGWGYEPIFVPLVEENPDGLTTAELRDTKTTFESHRQKAFRQLIPAILRQTSQS